MNKGCGFLSRYPRALTTRIEADLRVRERARVKPVFVFSGLGVDTRAGPPAKQGQAGGQGFGQGYGHGHGGWVEACADRQIAWERYEAGREDEATRLFANGLGFGLGSTKHYRDFVATGGISDNFWLAQTGFATLDSQDVAFMRYLEEGDKCFRSMRSFAVLQYI
ncbi:hypothetical protein BDZ89DRAFT_1138124 [Hymenopellis radicata]|nr:hypothetical protein BDZ89DRAFT_1138124 [Hymenopellis radicata]